MISRATDSVDSLCRLSVATAVSTAELFVHRWRRSTVPASDGTLSSVSFTSFLIAIGYYVQTRARYRARAFSNRWSEGLIRFWNLAVGKLFDEVLDSDRYGPVGWIVVPSSLDVTNTNARIGRTHPNAVSELYAVESIS